MELIYSLEDMGKMVYETGVSLGTFDGLHRGHQRLINKLIKKSKSNGYKSIVYTFANHPREITSKKNKPKKIISVKQKIELFNKIGIDFLILVNFDDFHRNIKAENFITDILMEKLNMHSMVVGFDCRFGKNAEGNIKSLKRFSQKYDFDLEIVPPIKIENQIVSSTLIRKLLSKGLIGEVNNLLGRNYSIFGKVIKGKQLGSKLGFPTANISIDLDLCLPKKGVYVTKTHLKNRPYYSVTNVGLNPTFKQNTYNVETYILDFNKNIYNEEIRVEFLERIRDELKFNNVASLCEQISQDIIFTKKYFKLYKNAL
ncbi:MAG: riboflavin kinase / adenylyltransferase [Candidatus Petromonas sp.]|jgi:riboflavin kinase/FMN adenylyltransferase|nr:riboflavin kinase / adenylyltransferase [Candidatus Petromonas sp.]